MVGVRRWFATGYDLLITPAVIMPPFEKGLRYPQTYDEVDLHDYLGWMVLSWAVTVTNCPCIVVPCGATRSGLPVAMQLIARHGDDAFLLSAARLYEQAHGHHSRVPVAKPGVGIGPLDLRAQGPTSAKAAHQHHFPKERDFCSKL